MKDTIMVILLVVLAAFGMMWYRENQAAVAFRAQAQLEQKSLQTLIDSLHVRDVDAARRDSVTAAEKVKLLRQNRQLQIKAASTQVETDSLLEQFRETLDVDQRMQLDSIKNHYVSLIELKDQQIRNLTAIVVDDSVVIARKNATLVDYRSLNQALMSQVDRLTKASRPSALDKVTRYAVLGFAAVAALK